MVNNRERRYTHGHHESVLRSHRWRTEENSAAYLLPELRPGQALLDVGCGPGTITAGLADRVAPGRVVAIDASAEVVDEARRLLVDRGHDPDGVRVGDAYDLDEPDGGFDVVHAHQVLQHLGDPLAALAEMRRVCAPGGVVAARDADYAAMAWYPRDSRLDRWSEVYRATATANGAQPDAGRRLGAWFRAAGFTSITVGASTWCFADPEDRAWWGTLWAGRVTDSAFAHQARDAGLTDHAEQEAMAEAFRAWANHRDGWFVVVHGEVVARQ